MGRAYTIEFENVTVSAVQDLFEIHPLFNELILVSGFEIDQITNVQDASEEMLRCQFSRGGTGSGSGGSGTKENRIDSNDTVGPLGETNNTTVAPGTFTPLHSFAFNIRFGYEWWWPLAMRPRIQSGTRIVIRLLAAPAGSISMSGSIYCEGI